MKVLPIKDSPVGKIILHFCTHDSNGVVIHHRHIVDKVCFGKKGFTFWIQSASYFVPSDESWNSYVVSVEVHSYEAEG